MGSGKSSVGEQLAKSLDLPFYDTDKILETQESLKISEIFEAKGEQYFRNLEHELVKKLAEYPSCVIATGGGMPVYNNNMKILNHAGITYYLKVSVKVLTERIFSDFSRPLVRNLKTKNKLYHYISGQMSLRSTYYNQSMKVIRSTNKSVNDICIEITNHLKYINK